MLDSHKNTYCDIEHESRAVYLRKARKRLQKAFALPLNEFL